MCHVSTASPQTERSCRLLWNAILALWLSPQDFRSAEIGEDAGGAGYRSGWDLPLGEHHGRIYAKACEVGGVSGGTSQQPYEYANHDIMSMRVNRLLVDHVEHDIFYRLTQRKRDVLCLSGGYRSGQASCRLMHSGNGRAPAVASATEKSTLWFVDAVGARPDSFACLARQLAFVLSPALFTSWCSWLPFRLLDRLHSGIVQTFIYVPHRTEGAAGRGGWHPRPERRYGWRALLRR